MKKVLISTAAILSFATGAMAFEKGVDTDNDGVLSFDEMVAAYPDMTQESFAEIDVDQDGMISADEWTAAKNAGILM